MTLARIARLDVPHTPWSWPFAADRLAEIQAHFAHRQRQAPLWNGRVLMLRDHVLDAGVLRTTSFETDFASFIAWRDWGFPDRTVHNGFAMGALRTRDGAFLLGVMGAHTASAGSVYFPAGTPDPADLVDGCLDFEGSVRREVAEETGLGPDDVEAEPGWHVVFAGPRLALMKVLHVPQTADEARARIRAHLAREETPELADIRIVRGPADLDRRMPPFVTAFLSAVWG